MKKSLLVLAFLANTSAWSAEPLTEVTGDSIFGFTDPTDVGTVGDRTITTEMDYHVGRSGLFYSALYNKTEYGYTIAHNTWVAASLFGNAQRTRVDPTQPYHTTIGFSGASFEIVHRVLERDFEHGNPFAVSLSVEPQWYRFDSNTAAPVTGFVPEIKLFSDAVIIKDTLYWGGNINWAPQWQQARGAPNWQRGSNLNLSNAFAWEAILDKLYLGVEQRFEIPYGKIAGQRLGNALFVGPTFAYHVTPTSTLSGVWQHQLTGRNKTQRVGSRLDTADYERNVYQLKYSFEF